MKVWLDGRVIDEGEARISPFDHGLLVGNGVFETLRVYDGVPFAWTRHHARLVHSGAGLGLEIPESAALRTAADDVLAANALREGRLRITVTGGPGPLGSERGHAPPTVVVAASEQKQFAPLETVASVPWPRNERGAMAGLKTTSYGENVRALACAKERGANEAIFCNTRGELCEATGSNLFVVLEETACTPPPESGCLLGVTRALVLELGRAHRVPVDERVLSPNDLATADEAFLTSTTREVQAIGRVDDHDLTHAPGPITTGLQTLFWELVASNLDP